MCWPLLCFSRPFCIFEICLDWNPESCLGKQARYQLSHPSPYRYLVCNLNPDCTGTLLLRICNTTIPRKLLRYGNPVPENMSHDLRETINSIVNLPLRTDRYLNLKTLSNIIISTGTTLTKLFTKTTKTEKKKINTKGFIKKPSFQPFQFSLVRYIKYYQRR